MEKKCSKCKKNKNEFPLFKNGKEKKICFDCSGDKNKQEVVKNTVSKPDIIEHTNRFMEHHIHFKKINEEFLWRASFPVHKYNTKKIMVYINKL